MIRRLLIGLLALFATGVFAQYQPFYLTTVDVQSPDQQFVIDRAFLGNNTFLAFDIVDGTSSPSLTGWQFTLFYGRTQYATQGVSIAASSVSANRVNFLGATNTYFEPYNNYWVSLTGTDSNGYVKTFGTGRLIVDFDPLAGVPAVLNGLTPWNWNLIGPYSGTWPFYAGSNMLLVGTTTGLVLHAGANTNDTTAVVAAGSGASVAAVTNGPVVTYTVSALGSVTNAQGSGRLTLGISGGSITGGVDASGINTSDLYGVMAGTGVSVSQGSGPLAIVSVPAIPGLTGSVATLQGQIVDSIAADASLSGAVASVVGNLASVSNTADAALSQVGAASNALNAAITNNNAASVAADAALSGAVAVVVGNVGSVSNTAVTASNQAAVAQTWAQAGSNLAASASALAGNASATLSNTSFAVNGQNITGRWFAVGNTADGENAFVGGGEANEASGRLSTVGGGVGNEASGEWSTIAGGEYHIASGQSSAIGGGTQNRAYGYYSTVAGGFQNVSHAQHSFIGGGTENIVSNGAGVVGGGMMNQVIGNYGTVPGGANNIAGEGSFAAGVRALATNNGAVVFSSPGGDTEFFGSRGDNTFNVRSVGGVYFLAPALYIQDTNGNTVAAFTATNSTISGDLNLTGYVTTGAHATAVNTLTTGKQDYATAIAWSNAQNVRITANETGKLSSVTAASTYATTTRVEAVHSLFATQKLNVADAATTYTTTGTTASLRTDLNTASNALRLSIGLVGTNAMLRDAATSNLLFEVYEFASNITAAGWSGFAATGTVDFASNTLTGVKRMILTTNGSVGNVAHELSVNAGDLAYFIAPGSPRTIMHAGNFSTALYVSQNAYNTQLTNVLVRRSGFIFPTTNTASGAAGQMFVTNGHIVIFDAQSNRWGRAVLNYDW
jgi:hypothetical protein